MKDSRYLCILGLLAGLLGLFAFTPLGLLHLGPISATLFCIPVLVGTLALGVKAGVILSLCFSLISFSSALQTPDALSIPLLQASIVYPLILSFLPRIFIPVTTHLVFKVLHKKHHTMALVVSSAVGSLTNTVLYMGCMLCLYGVIGVDSAPVIGVIVSVFVVIDF